MGRARGLFSMFTRRRRRQRREADLEQDRWRQLVVERMVRSMSRSEEAHGRPMPGRVQEPSRPTDRRR